VNGGARIALGGTAVVCCVHDRRKRVVVTERRVVLAAFAYGVVYDVAQHRIHRCGCCENLFLDATDEPAYCATCTPKGLVHPLGGPLTAPIGEVSG
jgi:hypothetical protein